MKVRDRSWWTFLPPSGPVISLLLIGLVLLSALLYYRAVKIQRFLEPALAVSQPRNEFTKGITKVFQDVFGQKEVNGIRTRGGAIQMDGALLFTSRGALTPWGDATLKKLGRVFVTLLQDERMRSSVDSIHIVGRYPAAGMPAERMRERLDVQLAASFVHESLLRMEPELARTYASYFSSGAQPVRMHEVNANRIDFIVIPSEFLHIEVLERLEKYMY